MKAKRHWLRSFGALLFLISANVLFSFNAYADQEGRVPITHLQFDANGLEGSGTIHVEGEQSDQGIGELRVSAFGRVRALTPAQLGTLRGETFNGIGLTYSQGDPSVGGRRVMLLLCQAFSSGSRIVAVITILEKGEIRVERRS
jgi:hypothetical protein